VALEDFAEALDIVLSSLAQYRMDKVLHSSEKHHWMPIFELTFRPEKREAFQRRKLVKLRCPATFGIRKSPAECY
jgi:hypothetical protein